MNSTAAILALLLAAPVLAAADSPRRSWELSPFSWIRRSPAEPGAPANSHPLQVDEAALVQALGAVRFAAGAKEQPLFAAAEAAELGKPLAEALAAAGPGEDLLLLSSSKREAGFFGKSLTVTARVFARDGRLNVIVHDTRLDFVEVYFHTFIMPTFKHGTRASAGAAVLKAAGAESPRPDWIALPLAAPATVAAPAPIPVLAAPAPKAAPSAAAVPPAAPAAAKPSPAAGLEERLRELKRLRDLDLITADEYAKKKQELLKGL